MIVLKFIKQLFEKINYYCSVKNFYFKDKNNTNFGFFVIFLRFNQIFRMI